MDVSEVRRIFSTRIRKLREGSKNQGEFADSVGISRGAMSYYEQEARTPDIGVLRAICEKCNVSADYLLGLIPDQNHAVSDVCRETGLSPEAARTLRIISQFMKSNARSYDDLMNIFGDDFLDAMKLTPFTSVPEVLNILLSNSDGLSLLTLVGAVILGAEIDSGEHKPVVRIKSAVKEVEIVCPIEDLAAALWVNIQSHADTLKKEIQEKSEPTQSE